jgi:hypothetical protein
VKQILSALTALLVLAACGGSETKTAVARTATPVKAAAVAARPVAPSPQVEAPALAAGVKQKVAEMGGAVIERVDAGEIRGTVVESMQASGFTYARVRTVDGDEWLVLPGNQAAIKGAKVVVTATMVAEKFQSQSLGRTFDRVTFGQLASTAKASANGMPSGSAHPAMAPGGPAMTSPHGGAAKPVADLDVRVEKATGANAKTVAEIWATREALGGNAVVVRGRVVKTLNGIMGRNWVHLRDGSGAADKGDHDVTITTLETVKVGDVVTVEGTVRIDKDFGAGYRYPVILEDGRFVK